jgi:cytoskeletal protein CcmA (bactofilin family)
MFGSDKKKQTLPTGGVDTLIGPQVTVRGDVHFTGGLYVEGRIIGSVIAEEGADAVVTLSEKGSIEGEVRAPHVIVNGVLRGDIYAANRIELAANARVEGNVHYKVVEMAAGAMITGRLIHGDAPQRQLPKPEAVKELKGAKEAVA